MPDSDTPRSAPTREASGQTNGRVNGPGEASDGPRRVQAWDVNHLNALGEKIFLDRYAEKDMDRSNLTPGDVAVVCVDTETGQREIGTVVEVGRDEVAVELIDETVVRRAPEHVDRPLETHPDQMQARVARGVAAVEDEARREQWEENFRWLLEGWKFVPGGRILTAAGTEQDLTYYNCYVIPSPHDSREGIVETLSEMTEIMSRGGGVGINLSTLRPRYAPVEGVNGRSSGSVSWGSLYSYVTGLIEQGGSRRGALMLILNVWHPDVAEFISAKREMGRITNANISVGITDDFMQAVDDDAEWSLVFPDTTHPAYDEEWDGDLDAWRAAGRPVIEHRTVRARELWDTIIESAWASAEPGLWFVDRSNKMSNSHYYAPLVCTNPCVTGETLVSTEHGYTKARDLEGGMRIRTPAGLRPIEKVYNNGVKPIFRVEFSDGGHLECTADHQLKVVRDKRYEWVAVSELEIDDKVLVAPNEAFGPRRNLPERAQKYVALRELDIADHFDRRLGFLVGTVIGNGTFRKVRSRNSHSYQCVMSFGSQEQDWYDYFVDLMDEIGIHTNRTLQEKEIPVGAGEVVVHSAVRLDCYKLATLMAKIGMEPNLRSHEKHVPPAFLDLDRDFLAGVLDGLFSTDGSVLQKQDNPMLRFHTASRELAEQVRLILLQFGIHGRIYRQTRDEDLEYDGRSMYGTGEKFDVVIMNEGIARFYSEIDLSHAEKAARLKEVAEEWHFIGGTWTASVISIQDTEREEEVFDVYEPKTLTWTTNGYVSLDCGEQPLPAWSVCNLGAVNLSRFHEDGEVDWGTLRQAVRYAVRFLDNVIDATPYFFDENREQQLSERRVGLGTMGLAELMIRLGLRYGSPEGNAFVDRLYRFIATEAYLASSEIAAEKGSFPKFEADGVLSSGFTRQMPDEVRRAIKENGLRNVTVLTQAPTGTTGTMVGTSTGIEPFYSWTYFRKSRLGTHEERVAVVEDWKEAHPDEPLPDHFVTAMDLTPEEHITVQATIQRWVDSSISKTCNVPNEYTVEQTRELYEFMYRLGCKGGTIYRDGSRDEQVLSRSDENGAAQAKGQPVETEIKPRPRQMRGTTHCIHTPLGKAYVTVNRNGDDEPFEVFVNLGKAGSDLSADAEAIGRLISLTLRLPSPLSAEARLQKVVEELEGIGGSRSVGFGAERIRSLPDGLASALRADLADEVEERPEQPSLFPSADLCPQCGYASFVRIEGCRKCFSCGFSEC